SPRFLPSRPLDRIDFLSFPSVVARVHRQLYLAVFMSILFFQSHCLRISFSIPSIRPSKPLFSTLHVYRVSSWCHTHRFYVIFNHCPTSRSRNSRRRCCSLCTILSPIYWTHCPLVWCTTGNPSKHSKCLKPR